MIQLNLSIEQVNAILGILGNQPYGQVNQLIDAIITQGRPQAEAIEAEKAKEAPVEKVEAEIVE